MKIFAAAVLLCASATLAFGQNTDQSPYSFKGDRLGMSLSDFKKSHHDPGVWTIVAGGEKVWQSDLQCKDQSTAITTCK